MKKRLKKLNILFIVFTIIFTNISFAQPTLNQLEGKEQDFNNTYIYMEKGPALACDGELIVLGDSFAFLFCANIDKGVNYIVHQGYDVSKICREFLPHIKKGQYKYAFLMIGPNDFMEQTSIYIFRTMLQIIIADLKMKGMKVVITDYCDPDYSVRDASVLYYLPIKCFQYDFVIKELMLNYGLLYVEMRDLLAEYGRLPLDMVHPAKKMYPHVLERVENVIEQDRINSPYRLEE